MQGIENIIKAVGQYFFVRDRYTIFECVLLFMAITALINSHYFVWALLSMLAWGSVMMRGSQE